MIKLFILGNPGSGKSTVSRYVVNYVERQHVNHITQHINDYDILFKKFEEDTAHKRFHPTRRYRGFIVKDRFVYNEALRVIENTISPSPVSVEFAVVEFVRKSYEEAFKLFGRSFVVENSYFLFLDTDVATCKRRIHERVIHWKSSDDHYVPSLVFRLYDVRRNKFYIKTGLKADFGIDDSRVKIIHNKGKLQDILPDVEKFIDFILTREGISRLSLAGHKPNNK